MTTTAARTSVDVGTLPTDLFIGGRWLPGSAGRRIDVFDPATEQRITTVALTGGDGGPIGRAADLHLNVPSPSAARAQEVHRTLLHVICELVEATLTP